MFLEKKNDPWKHQLSKEQDCCLEVGSSKQMEVGTHDKHSDFDDREKLEAEIFFKENDTYLLN